MINWHLEKRKISELKNWEKNPRTISEKAFKELEQSVDTLGNFEPLVINVDGTVIAGNQRLRLEMKKGNSEVDVYVPERELSEEEVKKIGVISNRHSGEWDMDILANEFEDILKELNFDDLLPELVMEVNEDDYEEPEQLPSKVQLGEVWQLGRHRLMCGDSTKIEDVEKLMDGQKADMVFTDPPYGNADSGKYGRGKLGIRTIGGDDNADVLKDVISSRYSDVLIFFLQWRTIGELIQHLESNKIKLDTVGVWDKKNAGLNGGGGLAEQWEAILFCGNINYKKFGGNVFCISRDVLKRKDRPHPHMKPIQLLAEILNFVKGDIILDPFGGSGSTLIACEQTDRVCYMMELDTHYSSVIIDRWEKLTNKTAIKL